MKKNIFFFFLLTTILIFLPLYLVHGIESNYKIRRISPDGGLGTNGQRDVRQDKWGFIWIITVNNLYRFDGYTFKYYTDKLKKKDSSHSWSFERLEVDSKGDIYIASNSGLLRYNSLTDNFDYLYNESVNLVNEDKKGRLWISNYNSVGLFDKKTLEFTPVESDGEAIQNVSAIYTKDEFVFIGTKNGKIYLYDENETKLKNVFSEPEHNVVDIIYKDSLLYMLTENKGLHVISLESYKETKLYDFFYPDGDQRVSARALFVDKLGHLWISTQRGLYILNTATDEYKHFYYDKTDPYGMPSSSVWRISEDNQGNLWFGTYSGGLCFVNFNEEQKFKTFNGLTDELSYTVVSSFEEDERYLWIGTEGGGLNRYNKISGEFTYYKHATSSNSLSYDNIQSLLLTDKNNLWIGMSRGGLDHMNTKTGEFSHFSVSNNTLLNDHVERIVAEADSGIWIKYLMDRTNLTYLSLKDKKVEHFGFKTLTLPINGNISDIQRDAGDNLWIASSDKLLTMDVRTKEISVVPITPSETNNPSGMNILSFLVDDRRQEVWIGTDGSGLFLYDIQTQSLHKKADISKYNAYLIYSVNQDENGNIWMGTNNGLFSLNIETEILQQYGKSDGTQGQSYYPHATFKSKTGELYFGGNEGFTIVDTVKITFNDYKPDVIITDFFLDNVVVIPGVENSPLKSSVFQTEKLDLNYNQNIFSFSFTSTNYYNSDKNRFRYHLKGYDDKWIETDANHRIASYAKVPKGNYVFEIMTANNDGVWGELTSIELKVSPAPWFSFFAIVGYIIVALIIVWTIIRLYNDKRKQKTQFYLEEQEKKQKEEYHQAQLNFFTNVSHDFRTPLSLILATLEPLKAGDSIAKHMSVLENNAKRLLSLVNELMDFRSMQNKKIRLYLQKEDFNSFIGQNCSDFSEYAELKKIKFNINYDSTIPLDLYFDKKLIEKIILNLLNNALKYTQEGGSVEISTLADIKSFKSSYANHIVIKEEENTDSMFGFVISDSGIGISESSIGLIFDRYYRINESNGTQHIGSGIGLALVKSLVKLHRGYIAIYSERGKGSNVVVGFPSAFSDEDCNEDIKENRFSFSEPFNNLEDKNCLMPEISVFSQAQSHKKILLVEDNDDLRELLSDMLSEYYEVVSAENGLKALKVIEEEDIDMLITDVMMPGMDGIELTRTLKENIATSHIPVVMLTARAGSDNQIEGLHYGADVYIEKPANKQILLLFISNLFKQQARIKDFYAKHYFAQSNQVEPHTNKRDAEFMQNLINLVEINLSNTDIDVMQIASSLAMSRRTLYGKVKALTGQSVVEFIRNYRLRKAAQILIEEGIPITDVMDRVGIDNASYFSRIFKQEFGESPSDFVAKHHKL